MPLFQTAVLNKYLKQQDSARMATAYAAFRAHFHDAAVQADIREAKAQALQGQIERKDREINGLVHGLYGLGEEEVVEGR